MMLSLVGSRDVAVGGSWYALEEPLSRVQGETFHANLKLLVTGVIISRICDTSTFW